MTSINNPRWLVGAMDSTTDKPPEWQPAELATMLKHQLAAPLGADLHKLSPDLAQRYDESVASASSVGAGGATPKTFGELFTSPEPPLSLLQVVKDFA